MTSELLHLIFREKHRPGAWCRMQLQNLWGVVLFALGFWVLWYDAGIVHVFML